MTGAELQLNLITLILGFILIEVLSGLMRVFRARLPSGPGTRPDIRIGWLTPMLAAYTMLNILMWWITIGGYSDVVPLGYDTLTAALILCSFYYFAASMIFPDKPRDWKNIDDWFWLHRRQILVCLLVANVPVVSLDYLIGQMSPGELVVNNIVIVLQLTALVAAIVARSYRIVFVALAMMIAVHLSFIPINIFYRQGAF